MTTTDGQSWDMWAYAYVSGFHTICDRKTVEHRQLPEPIAPVRVTEDLDGEYYGWVTPRQPMPIMIQHSFIGFSMQFPDGPYAAQEAGQGRIVALRVERREESSCA